MARSISVIRVRTASARIRCCVRRGPAWDFAVLAASILRVTLAVIDAMDIHLAAAIGAVHQAGQGMGLPSRPGNA